MVAREEADRVMDTIIVSKAAHTPGARPVRDICIQITGGTGAVWSNLADWDDRCAEQAMEIEITLHMSLPGGVYDRLTGLMLARKASHFAVAHGAGEAAL